ncbi:MAG: ATP-dependent DNA ligase [Candidatus Woesearchaeota archaeon]
MRYEELAQLYDSLSSTSKRLEKINLLSRFLKKADGSILLLLQGRVFGSGDEKIGVSEKTVIKAIALSAGVDEAKINQSWKSHGDLGSAAAELIGKKSQSTLFSTSLTVKKVHKNLQALARMTGTGAVNHKTKLISELLTSATPIEAKYIVRTVLEDLRVGVAQSSVRDAMVWAFCAEELGLRYDGDLSVPDREKYNDYVNRVQEALDMTNDLEKVFNTLKKGIDKLNQLSLTIGFPVNPMLAIKAKDIDDAFDRVGSPAAFEYKYDGFRIQIHKKGNTIQLFTRRLEDVTAQFPDVVSVVKSHVKTDSCILDAEVVGFDRKTKKYLPFQSISQRIKRKYDVDNMAKDYPVELNVFDILEKNKNNLIKEPFDKRRGILEDLIPKKKRYIYPSELIRSDSPEEVSRFFEQSLSQGNEGLMAKKLDAPYKPGSRVGHMVKIKGTMENLELVIVGATWGEGKRVDYLSSFTLACVDDGQFLDIGKVGTGIKEKEDIGISFRQLTELLRPHIISESEKTVRVSPKIVVEVAYEEIQKSPTYSSGFALRFPRLLFLREDRSPEDATSLEYIKELFEQQV